MPRRREPKRESCLSSLCRALAGFSSPCQPPAPRFQISRRRYIFLRMQLVASRFPVPRLLPLYWARANLSTDCAFSYFFIRRKSYFMRKKDWRDSQEKAKKKRRKKKAQSLVYFSNETRGAIRWLLWRYLGQVSKRLLSWGTWRERTRCRGDVLGGRKAKRRAYVTTCCVPGIDSGATNVDGRGDGVSYSQKAIASIAWFFFLTWGDFFLLFRCIDTRKISRRDSLYLLNIYVCTTAIHDVSMYCIPSVF
jgi:hypothetical protein